MGDASPFDTAPAARAEHAARMSEAQATLQEGRPARMAEAPRAAVREDQRSPGTTADFGDDELGRLSAEVAEARGRPQAPETAASPASDAAPSPQAPRPSI